MDRDRRLSTAVRNGKPVPNLLTIAGLHLIH